MHWVKGTVRPPTVAGQLSMQVPTVEEEMFQAYQSGIISVYDFMLTKTYAILVFLVDLSTKKKCSG